VIFHLLARQDWIGATEDAPVAKPGEDGYAGAGGEAERFPHVYGALPRDRVAFVRRVSG
jgi:uncharacterized protein (DUF952 family)